MNLPKTSYVPIKITDAITGQAIATSEDVDEDDFGPFPREGVRLVVSITKVNPDWTALEEERAAIAETGYANALAASADFAALPEEERRRSVQIMVDSQRPNDEDQYVVDTAVIAFKPANWHRVAAALAQLGVSFETPDPAS